MNVLSKYKKYNNYLSFLVGIFISLIAATISFLIVNQFLSSINSFFIIVLFILLILIITLLYHYPELGLSLAVGGTFTLSFILKEILGIQGNLAVTVYSLALLGLLISFIKNKTFLPLLSTPVLAILAFALVLTIGTSYSPSPEYGTLKVINLLVFILFPFLAFLHFSARTESLKIIFILLLFFSIFLGIASTIVILSKGVTASRFGLLDQNSILFSRSLGIGFLLLLYELRNSTNITKIILIICLPFLFLPIFVSGSRGPLLALGFSITIYMLLTPGNVKIKIYSIIFISIIIVVIYNTFNFKGLERIQGFFEGNWGDENALCRLSYYSTAWKCFLDSPLFGIGTGGFSNLISYRDEKLYPHNIFLEIAAENGIIGLLIFVGFLLCTIIIAYSLLYKIKLGYETKEIILISLSLFLFGLIASFFSGDITGNQYIWYGSVIIWGQYLANRKKFNIGN